MKRFLSILLVLMLLVVTVSGCQPSKPGPNSSSETPTSSEDTIDDTENNSSEEPPEEPDESEPWEEETSYEDDVEEEEEEKLTPIQKTEREIGQGTNLELLNAAISSEIDANGNLIVNNQNSNAVRVANAIRKAQLGETVTIGFVGGENTGNMGKNVSESGYVKLVRDWWMTNFQSDVNVINAGVYTMSSGIAVYRLNQDLLQYKPDLVFVDFAVQDAFGGGAKSNSAPFENLVRRIMESSNKPGVVVLLLGGAENTSYVMTPGNCDPIATAARYELEVAKYYKLPVIDFNNAVWDAIFTIVDKRTYGEVPLLSWDTFAQYNIALNDVGHLTLANMITNYIEKVMAKLSSIPKAVPDLPANFRYGNNKFMGVDMITTKQLFDKSIPGYSLRGTAEELRNYGYSVRDGDIAAPTSERSIVAYRPSKGEGEDTEGAFLDIDVPEVTSGNPIYVLINASERIVADALGWHKYSPVEVVFYDKNGDVKSTAKPVVSNWADAIQSWRVSSTRVPEGTTRIEIKIYVAGGTIMFHGLAVENLPR